MGCVNSQTKDALSQIQVPENDQELFNNIFTITTNPSSNSMNRKEEDSNSIKQPIISAEYINKINKKIKYPRLVLYGNCSETLKNIEAITITPNSIECSRSNCLIKPEGVFNFGNTEIVNDYFINYDKISKRQFSIVFNKDKYFIVDCQESSGVFLKINARSILNKEAVFIFPNGYLSLNIMDDDILNILFKLDDKVSELTLHPNGNLFKIGRGKECEMVIKNESISRVQCSLAFDDGEWVIYDGMPNKCSTNGLWQLIQGQQELSNGIILKTGTLNIKVQRIEVPNYN